jgi:hypothetical protein
MKPDVKRGNTIERIKFIAIKLLDAVGCFGIIGLLNPSPMYSSSAHWLLASKSAGNQKENS